MRVLIITQSFPPDHTGAGVLALRSAIRMEEQFGVTTSVLKISYRKEKPCSYEINNVHVSCLNTKIPMRGVYAIFFLLEIAWKLNKYFKTHRYKIDLVHCLTVSWFTLFALRIAKIYGIPSILESTLFGDIIPAQGHFPGLIYKYKEVLRNIFMKSASAYKAYTPLLVNEFASTGIVNKVHCIPAPIDVDHYKPPTDKEKNELKNKLNLSLNGSYILFVGGICSRKGVKLLVEAFVNIASLQHDVYLLLVGPTDGYDKLYLAEIKQIIDTNQLADRVLFTDKKVENVVEYMKASDVFVLPSEREGFGAVTVEAMATGLPTVVTNIVGISEYQIEDGTDGYIVYKRTPAALGKKIVTALNESKNPDSELKRNARKKVCSVFSSEIVNEKTYKLYQEITH